MSHVISGNTNSRLCKPPGPERSKISCLDGLSLTASAIFGDLFLAKESAVRVESKCLA